MARELVNDYYQAFRFKLSFVAPAATYMEVSAGFNNVTIPEVSQEAAEYREGNFIWTRKQPGVPTVSNATFQQGVSTVNTGGNGRPFFNWVMASINGSEYRSDVEIVHLHRSFSPGQRTRVIKLGEAFPSRVKPDGDLDATSSEISLREMDVECEWVDVTTELVTLTPIDGAFVLTP